MMANNSYQQKADFSTKMAFYGVRQTSMNIDPNSKLTSVLTHGGLYRDLHDF